MDVETWKSLIPFGSSLLGSLTGGTITYCIFRYTETKKTREKRLESLFQLRAEVQRLGIKALNLSGKLKPHVNNHVSEEAKDILEKMDELLLNDIFDAEVELPALAIYINNDVVNKITESFREIQASLEEVIFKFRDGKIDVQTYLKGKVDSMNFVNEKSREIVDLLELHLNKYYVEYSEGYIKG